MRPIDENNTMQDISELGFDAFFESQMNDWPRPSLIPARVASEHRDRYEVWTEQEAYEARLAGKLRGRLGEIELPRAGDWLALDAIPEPGQTAVVEWVFRRKTVLTRGAAGQEAHGQVLAANVDVVFVVCGLDADYSPNRIERYVARIWASGAQPIVVLNKKDTCPDTDSRLAEIETRCPGVTVLATSAVLAEGLESLRQWIGRGQTGAFVGSSGAGKSTLINALAGEERMATQEVRAVDSRGRHTTTRRQLIRLPGGGLLLDTPGLRELQLPDDEGLRNVFADIQALASGCRYRDCLHGDEPGCAVKAAVTEGTLPAERYEHYRKLEREARAYQLRHDVYLRHKAARVWKSLDKEGKEIRRRKEGR